MERMHLNGNAETKVTRGVATFLRFSLAMLFAFAAFRQAHGESLGPRPRLIMKPAVQIRSSVITVGEIAVISNTVPEYEKLVETLKAVQLGEAPPPKMRVSIPGVRVLAAIEAAGISRDSLGYSIPSVIEVERGGKIVVADDLLPSVQELFRSDPNLDLQVREVVWSSAQVIPLGETRYEVERLGMPQSGRVPLRVNVLVNEQHAARFLATAVVDDWREVPVLNKTIERGMLIEPTDIELVRLNLFKQPDDVAAGSDDVIGRRAKGRLAAGSTIRRSLIDIPPVIPQGKRVTMIYKHGALQATATGVAMEDGYEGGEIRIKNERSRKIVRAEVLNVNEVRVQPE